MRWLQGKKALFACGSASAASRQGIEKAKARGIPVFEIPIRNASKPILEGAGRMSPAQAEKVFGLDLEEWLKKSIGAIKKNGRVVIQSPSLPARSQEDVQNIRCIFAFVVSEILKRTRIDELFIEGGSTASRIAGRMGWKRFIPCAELAPGVVRMEINGVQAPFLTLKPGSYPWPGSVWE